MLRTCRSGLAAVLSGHGVVFDGIGRSWVILGNQKTAQRERPATNDQSFLRQAKHTKMTYSLFGGW